MKLEKRARSVTTDGQPPAPGCEESGAPQPIGQNGQHGAYWVLSPEERAKGFVRPLRRSYVHIVCGSETKMALAISQTYAREPSYYSSTFCCRCQAHYPVEDFCWTEDGQVVGS